MTQLGHVLVTETDSLPNQFWSVLSSMFYEDPKPGNIFALIVQMFLAVPLVKCIKSHQWWNRLTDVHRHALLDVSLKARDDAAEAAHGDVDHVGSGAKVSRSEKREHEVNLRREGRHYAALFRWLERFGELPKKYADAIRT